MLAAVKVNWLWPAVVAVMMILGVAGLLGWYNDGLTIVFLLLTLLLLALTFEDLYQAKVGSEGPASRAGRSLLHQPLYLVGIFAAALYFSFDSPPANATLAAKVGRVSNVALVATVALLVWKSLSRRRASRATLLDEREIPSGGEDGPGQDGEAKQYLLKYSERAAGDEIEATPQKGGDDKGSDGGPPNDNVT